MGVVGSLPSSSVISNIKEEPILLNDECSYRIVNINEIDCHRNYLRKLDINDENCSLVKQEHSRTMNYGPIKVIVRKSQPPTLATGRRSKFLKLEGEEAIKRDLRRKRNRDAAKKLKEKRFFIEQQLQNDIQQLEFREQILISRVKNLEAYKKKLEYQYEQILDIHQKISKRENYRRKFSQTIHLKQVKEENPSSPQWQNLFSI